MRNIIIILSFLFCWSFSFSQPIVQRSSTAITEQDGRLSAQLNLFIPRYTDTTQANISSNIGIDSCGAQIYTYSGDTYWIRACNPTKHWVKIIKSGDVSTPTWQQTLIASSALTQDNTINIGGNNFSEIAALGGAFLGNYKREINQANSVARTSLYNGFDSVTIDMNGSGSGTIDLIQHNTSDIQNLENILSIGREGGLQIISTALADRDSVIITNTPHQFYLRTFDQNGSESSQVNFSVTNNLVEFSHDSSSANKGFLNFKLSNLPASNNSSDSVIVKNSSGYLAYRASGILVNNGISRSGDTVQLGQTVAAAGNPALLNTNREIPTNGFSVVFTGSGRVGIGTNAPASNTKLTSVATGTDKAIQATSVSGLAVNASATVNAISGQSTATGIGVSGSSFGGIGVQGTGGTNGIGGRFTTTAAGATADLVSLELQRDPTGGGVSNGVGQTIMFRLPFTNGATGNESGRIVNYYSNAVSGAQSSNFAFHLVNSSVSGRKVLLESNGQWTWDGYPSLTQQTDTTNIKPLGYNTTTGLIQPMANWSGSGGGSVSLNNIGSGYRWLATPSGNFKTVVASNTILWDSTTNSNALTAKADTSVLATQYDLLTRINNANLDTTLRIGNITNRSIRIKESTDTSLTATLFGTSVTAGFGAPNNQFRYSTLFCNLMGLTESNLGIAGQKLQIDFNLATIPTKTNALNCLVFEFGTNDASQQNGTTLTYLNFITVYKKVLDTCFARGWTASKIYMMSPAWFSPASGANLVQYVGGIDSLAQANGCVFVNQYATTAPRGNGGLANDGQSIHPDSIGHSILFKNLFNSYSYNNFYRNQSLLVNGITELDTLVLRKLKQCTKGDLLLALDSAGHVSVMNDSFFIWNMRPTGQPTFETHKQIASINITDTVTAGFMKPEQYIFINGVTGSVEPSTGIGLAEYARTNAAYIEARNYNTNTALPLHINARFGSSSGQVYMGLFVPGNTSASDRLLVGGNILTNAAFRCGEVVTSTTYGKFTNIETQTGGSGYGLYYSRNGGTGLFIPTKFVGKFTIDPNNTFGAPSTSGPDFYVDGDLKTKDTVFIGTVRNGTSSDSLLVINTGVVRKVAAPVAATTIYTGDGTLAGNRTISGAGFALTADNITNFRVNADAYIFAKKNATIPYTGSIIGSGNIYEFGYTPTATVFTKGAGLFIDTNNNVGLAIQAPTSIPLYATGNSAYVQGLQSNGGNFYRVDSVTTNITANLTEYAFRINATGGNITITLPAASTAFGSGMGIVYMFKRLDNSGNTVTIQAAGGDLIDGAASFTLTTQYQAKTIQASSSSAWDIR